MCNKMYSGKKLLILGANPETVSLIKKAKEMGIYTIVTDYDPHAFAKSYADKPCNVDAMDLDGLIKLAKDEQIDGVAIGVAEALLPTYCKLCTALDMPCFTNLEQVAVMIQKNAFKEKCHEYCVPTIDEYTIEEIDRIKYPVIVKPADSCSSKGITVCEDRETLLKAIDRALEYSRNHKYLIETYMTGDEVISYYIIQDGEPIFVGMCDRYTYKADKDTVQLPTSYMFPSRHIDEYLKYTDEGVKAMLKGLGIKNGSIFFQAFADDKGMVRIYEPGYRLNGAQEHLILAEATGVDAKEVYLNVALSGKASEVDLSKLACPKHEKIGCKLSPLVTVGKISKLRGLEEIAAMKDVVSVNPSYHEGDTVTGQGTLKQIVCRFFIASDTKEEMIETIRSIQKKLVVEDENGCSKLIGDFDTEIVRELY